MKDEYPWNTGNLIKRIERIGTLTPAQSIGFENLIKRIES